MGWSGKVWFNSRSGNLPCLRCQLGSDTCFKWFHSLHICWAKSWTLASNDVTIANRDILTVGGSGDVAAIFIHVNCPTVRTTRSPEGYSGRPMSLSTREGIGAIRGSPGAHVCLPIRAKCLMGSPTRRIGLAPLCHSPHGLSGWTFFARSRNQRCGGTRVCLLVLLSAGQTSHHSRSLWRHGRPSCPWHASTRPPVSSPERESPHSGCRRGAEPVGGLFGCFRWFETEEETAHSRAAHYSRRRAHQQLRNRRCCCPD